MILLMNTMSWLHCLTYNHLVNLRVLDTLEAAHLAAATNSIQSLCSLNSSSGGANGRPPPTRTGKEEAATTKHSIHGDECSHRWLSRQHSRRLPSSSLDMLMQSIGAGSNWRCKVNGLHLYWFSIWFVGFNFSWFFLALLIALATLTFFGGS